MSEILSLATAVLGVIAGLLSVAAGAKTLIDRNASRTCTIVIPKDHDGQLKR